MGEAIAAGLVGAAVLEPAAIVVAEPDPGKRERLRSAYGVAAVEDGLSALAGADVVILAVKPQVIDAVLSGLAPAVGGAIVVSIAAGATCAKLESLLPQGARVVRVMPNTPALVGAGMSIISGGSVATAEDVAAVAGLFGAVGEVVVLPETLQDACTAISGCGPAYMALFVDALALAAEQEGLDRELAQRLALQTMRGTVELIETTGMTPSEVIAAVSSPGGSTIAAVTQMESRGIREAIGSGVRAAVERSRELGR
jgi:pyrroline-5-carboxylate reductase